MHLRTVRGNTIHAAMAEASRLFGNDVVLMQTKAAEGDRPAEVIVALEESSPLAQTTTRTTVSRLHERQNAAAASTDDLVVLAGKSLGYSKSAPATIRHRATAGHHTAEDPPQAPLAAEPIGAPSQAGVSALAALFDTLQSLVQRMAAVVGRMRTSARRRSLRRSTRASESPTADQLERPSRYLAAIDRRIENIERSMSGSLIGYDTRWRQHPAFGDMTENGISVETAARVISTLAARGVRTDADEVAIRRELADELRRRMQLVVARRTRGRHMFVGPAGAGKTAMIAGLARDEKQKLGRVLVIVAQPAATLAQQLADPSVVFDSLGIDSVSVHSARQVEVEAETLARYDTILIDTPPLPSGDSVDAKLPAIGLFAGIDNITTHLVVDVRNDLKATAKLLEKSGASVDALAITHLDALEQPGRLADFFTETRRTVYFASNAPGALAGVHVFSPARLAADAVNVDQWYSRDELARYFNHDRVPRSYNTTLTPTSTPTSSYLGKPLALNGRL